MLEEQLASSRRRAEQVLDLENNILQLKQTVNQISIVSILLGLFRCCLTAIDFFYQFQHTTGSMSEMTFQFWLKNSSDK